MVTSITGKIRIFLTQSDDRINWFSFVGYPNLKFDLDVILGKDNKLSFSIFPKIKRFVENLIARQLHRATLPNKIKIPKLGVASRGIHRRAKAADSSRVIEKDPYNELKQNKITG